jgi:hypothetical protein
MSNVVAAAVQEASLRGQIAATEEIIKIEAQSLDFLGKQEALGEVAGAAVAKAAGGAARPVDCPDRVVPEPGAGRNIRPRNLPVSVPSKLIEQRPESRRPRHRCMPSAPGSVWRSPTGCRNSP